MSYLAQREMDWGNFSEAKTFIGMPVIVIGSPYVSAGRGAKRGFVGIDGKVKPLETFCREMGAAHRIHFIPTATNYWILRAATISRQNVARRLTFPSIPTKPPSTPRPAATHSMPIPIT